MPFAKDLSIMERTNYDIAYQKTMALLSASILKLEERNDVAESPGEPVENKAKILDLQRKVALVEANHLAFKANSEQITPPTDDQLLRLSALIKEVDALTAQTKGIEKILQLTTDGINTWKEIQPT
ncbi:MAG: hypothetical protein WCZ86_08580 [Desulfurivibrionaceae bacterium]|jgi:hypothetical protein